MGAILPIASLALTAIGAGTSAIGALQQQRAQADAMSYRAALADRNRAQADILAKDALARGRVAEDRQRSLTRQRIGLERAALAGHGVKVDTGSALDLLSDTAQVGELDALTIRNNAEREALQFQIAGDDFSAEAAFARAQSRRPSGLEVGATLLTAAAPVADKWLVYRDKGLLSGFGRNTGFRGTVGNYSPGTVYGAL